MSLMLSDAEVVELTGKRRRGAQVRALCAMGIEHRPRPDGSVAVARQHYEQVFGIGVSSTSPRKTAPDFSMVT